MPSGGHRPSHPPSPPFDTSPPAMPQRTLLELPPPTARPMPASPPPNPPLRKAQNSESDPYHGREATAKLHARFVSHLFACSDVSPPLHRNMLPPVMPPPPLLEPPPATPMPTCPPSPSSPHCCRHSPPTLKTPSPPTSPTPTTSSLKRSRPASCQLQHASRLWHPAKTRKPCIRQHPMQHDSDIPSCSQTRGGVYTMIPSCHAADTPSRSQTRGGCIQQCPTHRLALTNMWVYSTMPGRHAPDTPLCSQMHGGVYTTMPSHHATNTLSRSQMRGGCIRQHSTRLRQLRSQMHNIYDDARLPPLTPATRHSDSPSRSQMHGGCLIYIYSYLCTCR
jgi:hypothetical protein